MTTPDSRPSAVEEVVKRVDADLETVTGVCAVGLNHPIGCEARSKGVFWCDCGFMDAVVRLNSQMRPLLARMVAEAGYGAGGGRKGCGAVSLPARQSAPASRHRRQRELV